MIDRRWLGSLFVAFVMLATPLLDPRIGRAQDERYVTAAAECVRRLDSEGPLPVVEVTIENQSDLPLHVAYVKSFGTLWSGDGPLTGLSLAEPEPISIAEVPDGESMTFEAPWNGGELRRSDTIVALVVTSAGVFLPACGDEEPQRMTYAGETPDGERAIEEESAIIATEMIGQLESWLAYPALYALLHPDALAVVPYATMACWYDEQFGAIIATEMIGQLESWLAYSALYALLHPDALAVVPYATMACWYDEQFGATAGDDRQSIYGIAVADVEREAWTWAVSGEEYEDSALVSYQQVIGGSPDAEPAEGSMHLVLVDGIWRWFFGGSAEGIASMSSDCGLPEFS